MQRDSVFDFCRDPQQFLLDTALAEGAYARVRINNEPFMILSDPDAVHDVLHGSADDFEKGALYAIPRTTLGEGLFTVDEPDWSEHQKVIGPLFSRSRIRGLAATIQRLVARQVETWQRSGGDDEVDLLPVTGRLAFDVVAGGLLAIDREPFIDELFDLLDRANNTPTVSLGYLAARLHAGRPLEYVGRSKPLEEIDRLDQLFYTIVDARLAAPGTRDDLIGGAIASPVVAAMPQEARRVFLRDLIATMLTAGSVTTGETMFWTLYLLAGHRAAQDLARAEAGRHTDPAGDTVDRLPYLAAVISETLRLYPPVWFIGRVARRDVRLSGVEIAADTQVICSPFVLHRHPDHWPEAGEFRPERFLNVAKGSPASFIPFGTGFRVCLGRSLALMEIPAMVASTLRAFDVQLASDAPASLAATYSMRPRERVLFRLRSRS